MSGMRSRWAAIGAAIAVALGGGGVALVAATSPADAVAFVPITPCRVLDTRPGTDNVGPRSAPLAADETYTVDAIDDSDDAGDCAEVIPSSATAISMNVTTLDATVGTFLTIWEADVTPRPSASSLNPAPGQPPTPNAVTTNLNGGGEFSIYNLAGSVNVLADINGYYTDHDHDDRYYTEAEVDAAITAATTEPPWSVGVTIADVVEFSTGGIVAQGSFVGVRYEANATGTAFLTFRIPPNHPRGTDVDVDVMMGLAQFGSPPLPCDSVWRIASTRVYRLGSPAGEPATAWVRPSDADDFTEITFTQADFDDGVVEGGTATIDGADLRAGDLVTTSLIRFGGDVDDTCPLIAVVGATARAAN